MFQMETREKQSNIMTWLLQIRDRCFVNKNSLQVCSPDHGECAAVRLRTKSSTVRANISCRKSADTAEHGFLPVHVQVADGAGVRLPPWNCWNRVTPPTGTCSQLHSHNRCWHLPHAPSPIFLHFQWKWNPAAPVDLENWKQMSQAGIRICILLLHFHPVTGAAADDALLQLNGKGWVAAECWFDVIGDLHC